MVACNGAFRPFVRFFRGGVRQVVIVPFVVFVPREFSYVFFYGRARLSAFVGFVQVASEVVRQLSRVLPVQVLL